MADTVQGRRERDDELRATRPFFYILLLALALVFAIAVRENPSLRSPSRLIPFTLLMGAHALLHWHSPRFIAGSRRLARYLALQIVFVVVLTLLSGSIGVTIGLTLGLAGETIGILENWRYSLLASLGFMGLLAVNILLIGSPADLPGWLGAATLMLAFVFVYIELYMRQMSARAEAQRLLGELEGAHRQLGEYAQQVEVLTRDAERQRMARALHDTLAQGLAGLILQLEGLEAHLEQGHPERVAQIAAQAKARARTTLAEARRAIDDLRAGSSTDALTVISQEVERFRQATGIDCRLTLPTALPLPPDLADNVIRSVAEGLSNVARHARATQAWVQLDAADGGLRVEIGDDGCGFAVDGIPAGHYGLVGLRERARLAGGALRIESAPGSGTTIHLRLPLPAKAPAS